MTKKGTKFSGQADTTFVNEHYPYARLSRADRHALRDTLSMAFPIGKSSHKLWSDFRETTAFIRRIKSPTPGDPPEGILGGAIVMSYAEDQYDYLAYIAVHPDYRHKWRILHFGSEPPRHGTELMRYVYTVMRSKVSATRQQRYLMIEPAGDVALRFYLRALPSNEYPLRLYEEDGIISVGYDGLAL